MTSFNRPNEVTSALNSLIHCTHSGELHLDIFQEPEDKTITAIKKWIKKYKDCTRHVRLHINKKRFGWTKNSLTALTYGFNKGDYVILIEDDQLFAKDFLELHEHFRDRYANNEFVFSASAGHYTCNKVDHCNSLNFTYTAHNFFHNQGWGTWSNRWSEMCNSWENFETFDDDGNAIKNYDNNGWDWKMQNVVMGKRVCVVPFLSRVHNIGLYGAHCGVEMWEKQIKLSHWAGDRVTTEGNVYTYRNISGVIDPSVTYFNPTNKPL